MVARTKCGTLAYNSPEMVLRKNYNQTADWYSLGIIAYELTAGKLPYYHMNTVELKKMILDGNIKFTSRFHPNLREFIKGLIEFDPKKRLGANGASEIRQHKYFEVVDWNRVFNKKYQILDLSSKRLVQKYFSDKNHILKKVKKSRLDLKNTVVSTWSAAKKSIFLEKVAQNKNA